MLNILIIDDDKDILKVLKMVLKASNYNVTIVSTGKEGIKQFDKANFDIVITDLCMPEIGGADVAKYIKNSDKSDTPIMGITGTLWKIEDKNFDIVIPKPFTIKQLNEAIIKLYHNT